MFVLPDVGQNIVARRLQPIDLFRFQETGLPPGLDEKTPGVGLVLPNILKQASYLRLELLVQLGHLPILTRMIKSHFEPVPAEGLEKIIKRMDFKGPQRLCVTGRDEDDERRSGRTNGFDYRLHR
jgi:hypothetical protein